ncbi:spore gernimation protein GerA [Paenibacillus sp. FSL P4-0081]|uniref:spore germination protein n=1 Tax=Paenibacillus sp. FSL P4-0081 TaxID=1536769 RepID=UPI0004F6321B|nr:spore germination protein [Paenibacillus sp. FSL P4-0081]AIQ28076.1 spore gernimation protein GerA [Paenibacillus sp. FSL P4-0081]
MQAWKDKYTAYVHKQQQASPPEPDKSPLTGNLQADLQALQARLGDNGDLVVRDFQLFGAHQAVMLFFSSLVNTEQVREHVLKPLMAGPTGHKEIPEHMAGMIHYIWSTAVQVTQGTTTTDISVLPDAAVKGELILLIEGVPEALVLDMRQIDMRGVEQPQTEQVIRGPREGYVEKLENNLSLLRYRLQSTDFRIEISPIGTRTQSRVALCYIESIADSGLVAEAMRRISMIDTDGILDAGYIEQFIEDQPLSPFPQVQCTERPDKTVAALLEGRVAMLVDGSPFAVIVPALFNQFFQTVDDYTERFIMGSLIRIIRLIALSFSLFFPALYVSVISFNPELMPTDFAVAISGGRAGVPFPAVLEVLIMEVSMEVLREATIRLPQMIGGALSIVGVLVIGQAAVGAGLASPITVVIVALTTIGSFATPAYNAAIALRMLRFPLIILAGMFGLYGVMIGTILILNHLLFLESFGVPYMSPFIPGKWRDLKDTLVRVPLWWMRRRPSFLHAQNSDRLSRNVPAVHVDQILRQEGEPSEQSPADHNATRSRCHQ